MLSRCPSYAAAGRRVSGKPFGTARACRRQLSRHLAQSTAKDGGPSTATWRPWRGSVAPHSMGPPHPGAGPAASPYLVNGGDPLPCPREAIGTAAVPAGPVGSQFISLTAKAQHAAPLSLDPLDPRRPLPALFSPLPVHHLHQQARAGPVFCVLSRRAACRPSLVRPGPGFCFPQSPAPLLSPANAAKLARLEPLSGTPVLHCPPNTKRYLHAPTGRNRTAALPHYRLWHIRPVWGYGHFLSLLPCFPASLRSLPIGEPSRPDLHTRYQIPYRQIWGAAPEFHRARFPRPSTNPACRPACAWIAFISWLLLLALPCLPCFGSRFASHIGA